MTKETRKNICEENKKDKEIVYEIMKKDLLEEIYLAVKDYFVAVYEKDDEELLIKFLNGQKFVLTVKEVTD